MAKLSSGALVGIEGGWANAQFTKIQKARGVLLPAIEEHLLRKRVSGEDDEGRDTIHIHPSESCKADWCPRASWYRISGYPGVDEKFSMFMENIFEEGHDIHHKWQNRLWEMGLLAGLWGCYVCKEGWYGVSPRVCPFCDSALLYYNEVPLYREDLRVIGHADGEVVPNEEFPIEPGLIEIKSISLGTLRFEKPELFKRHQNGDLRLDKVWQEIRRPMPSHVLQAQMYMHLRGRRRMYMLYEWKPTQAVKEFVLPYDYDLIADIVESCKLVVEHIELGTPPKRPGWALASEHKNCKACPYQAACWNGESREGESKGPTVHVGENRGRRIRRRPVARS